METQGYGSKLKSWGKPRGFTLLHLPCHFRIPLFEPPPHLVFSFRPRSSSTVFVGSGEAPGEPSRYARAPFLRERGRRVQVV